MKTITQKTIDITDYETRKGLQGMSTEELRAINKYVVGILKDRKRSKISEAKVGLKEGGAVKVNHPKLSWRDNLILQKINKTRGVVQVDGAGRFESGWNVPLQMIEMK
tara:strand:- start:36 stop:359 length:324 start_codon:yes stop_codon:yes gene_type:complete